LASWSKAPTKYQTPQNVKAVEALPEPLGVLETSIHDMENYQSGMLILRVDPERFPEFAKRSAEITKFLRKQVGLRFRIRKRDAVGTVLGTAGYFWNGKNKTKERTAVRLSRVNESPKCSHRARLFDKYKASLERGENRSIPSGSPEEVPKLARRPKTKKALNLS